MGAPASAADGRPSIGETGDPGSELRMALGALKRAIIRTPVRRSGNNAPDCPVLSHNCALNAHPGPPSLYCLMEDWPGPGGPRGLWLGGGHATPPHGSAGV